MERRAGATACLSVTARKLVFLGPINVSILVKAGWQFARIIGMPQPFEHPQGNMMLLHHLAAHHAHDALFVLAPGAQQFASSVVDVLRLHHGC
jgi:hypothetical protein